MIGGASTREEARPQDALRVLLAHVTLGECGRREGVRRLRAIARQVVHDQIDRHIAGVEDLALDAQLHAQLVGLACALGIAAQPAW